MPQPWVSGPVTISIDGKEIGTAERFPRILIRSGWLPYFNDIGGPVIPMDMLWANKEAFCFADLNRWDENALQSARQIVGPRALDAGMKWDEDDVGSLMIHEGWAVPTLLQFPYADKEKYAGMPKGYRFLASWVEGPEEFSVLGTNPQKFHLVIHALPILVDGKWVLGELAD